jgi:hypothetical protein
MQKIIVYKTVYVTWCCYSLVVVVFSFDCLYNAFNSVRQSCWVHKKGAALGAGTTC